MRHQTSDWSHVQTATLSDPSYQPESIWSQKPQVDAFRLPEDLCRFTNSKSQTKSTLSVSAPIVPAQVEQCAQLVISKMVQHCPTCSNWFNGSEILQKQNLGAPGGPNFGARWPKQFIKQFVSPGHPASVIPRKPQWMLTKIAILQIQNTARA